MSEYWDSVAFLTSSGLFFFHGYLSRKGRETWPVLVAAIIAAGLGVYFT